MHVRMCCAFSRFSPRKRSRLCSEGTDWWPHVFSNFKQSTSRVDVGVGGEARCPRTRGVVESTASPQRNCLDISVRGQPLDNVSTRTRTFSPSLLEAKISCLEPNNEFHAATCLRRWAPFSISGGSQGYECMESPSATSDRKTGDWRTRHRACVWIGLLRGRYKDR